MRESMRIAVLAVLSVAALALVGPWLSPFAPDALDWRHIAASPNFDTGHWMGTDRLGRDLFSRTLSGARVSLLIAVPAALLSVVIGVTWGAIAGYAGGYIDSVMMRIVDVLHSLPYVFLVIVLASIFERGSLSALLVSIAAVGWLTVARIARAQTLSLKRRVFVEAAVAAGASTSRIVARHVVPNALGPVIVYATLTVPQMMVFESFLSFLGLGVQEPHASLGSLIRDGAPEMESANWLLIVPAGLLAILLLAFSAVGEGLRARLDP